MAEEHEADPHHNRDELAAGNLVIFKIPEQKEEHVRDDGRAENEEEHNRPGGVIHKGGFLVGGSHQLRTLEKDAGCDVDDIDDDRDDEPKDLYELVFAPHELKREIEQRKPQEQKPQNRDVEPEFHARPDLQPHEEGTAGPEDQGDQIEQEGIDDPIFPRGGQGHEQEYIAKQRNNRNINEIAQFPVHLLADALPSRSGL